MAAGRRCPQPTQAARQPPRPLTADRQRRRGPRPPPPRSAAGEALAPTSHGLCATGSDIRLPKLPDITKTFDDVLSAEEVDRLVDSLHDPEAKYQGLRTNGRYRALVFMGAWLGP